MLKIRIIAFGLFVSSFTFVYSTIEAGKNKDIYNLSSLKSSAESLRSTLENTLDSIIDYRLATSNQLNLIKQASILMNHKLDLVDSVIFLYEQSDVAEGKSAALGDEIAKCWYTCSLLKAFIESLEHARIKLELLTSSLYSFSQGDYASEFRLTPQHVQSAMAHICYDQACLVDELSNNESRSEGYDNQSSLKDNDHLTALIEQEIVLIRPLSWWKRALEKCGFKDNHSELISLNFYKKHKQFCKRYLAILSLCKRGGMTKKHEQLEGIRKELDSLIEDVLVMRDRYMAQTGDRSEQRDNTLTVVICSVFMNKLVSLSGDIDNTTNELDTPVAEVVKIKHQQLSADDDVKHVIGLYNFTQHYEEYGRLVEGYLYKKLSKASLLKSVFDKIISLRKIKEKQSWGFLDMCLSKRLRNYNLIMMSLDDMIQTLEFIALSLAQELAEQADGVDQEFALDSFISPETVALFDIMHKEKDGATGFFKKFIGEKKLDNVNNLVSQAIGYLSPRLVKGVMGQVGSYIPQELKQKLQEVIIADIDKKASE